MLEPIRPARIIPSFTPSSSCGSPGPSFLSGGLAWDQGNIHGANVGSWSVARKTASPISKKRCRDLMVTDIEALSRHLDAKGPAPRPMSAWAHTLDTRCDGQRLSLLLAGRRPRKGLTDPGFRCFAQVIPRFPAHV